MMQWTREHDRVLAEKCEGLKHFVYSKAFTENIYHRKENKPAANLFHVSHYNFNIADAIRAAEAWVAQDPEKRYYEIGRYLKLTGQKKFHVYFYEGRGFGSKCWIGTSDDLAEAIATALYKAVKSAGGIKASA